MPSDRAHRTPPPVQAVAFDLDGLMFNTEEVYFRVGAELMRRRGKQYSKQLSDAVMGRPPQVCFETMVRWHGLDNRWEELAAESETIFIEFLAQGVEPMPGLLGLLDALESARIPKAICTSSSPTVVSAVLGRFQMQPRFAFVLTAADITHGKPHPEIYLLAASRFGVEPARLVVLEDSQTGCRSAVDAGTLAVAVPAGLSSDHDFSFASMVVESLADARLYEVLGLPWSPADSVGA